MPGSELQMEIQPRACSQRSQGRQGSGGGGEPQTGEGGAERRDGSVAEERGPGEGDLGSGNNLPAGVLATLNFAVRENLKSTLREKEQF